jgi:hypothetical protein
MIWIVLIIGALIIGGFISKSIDRYEEGSSWVGANLFKYLLGAIVFVVFLFVMMNWVMADEDQKYKESQYEQQHGRDNTQKELDDAYEEQFAPYKDGE